MAEESPRKKSLSKRPPKQIKRAKRLRNKMSPPEVILWQYLRPKNNKAFKVRRQVALLPGIIVDFYIDRKKIAIEIDGTIHELKAPSDAARDQLLKDAGVTVVRISARRVFQNPQGVADLIRMIYLGEVDLQDLD